MIHLYVDIREATSPQKSPFGEHVISEVNTVHECWKRTMSGRRLEHDGRYFSFRNHWKKKGQKVLPYTKWRSNEETLEQLQSMLWFVNSRNKVFGKMSTVQKV